MMAYAVKEVFLTLQGEGVNVGRAAVFCRFAGCNLWTGREADRTSAVCRFCDTDFVGTDGPGGGRFAGPAELASAIAALWPGSPAARAAGERPLVVFTGGEPLLQLDGPLLEAVHAAGLAAAVETNGTIAAPPGLDWVCVSPKGGSPLVQDQGDELKLAFPQPGVDPRGFESLRFEHFFLQPIDGPALRANTEAAVRYCLAHPRWRLSLQAHKVLGLP